MDESGIFLASAQDKFERACEQCVLTFTNFLDASSQLTVSEKIKNDLQVTACLFGGFDGAERRAMFFFPFYYGFKTQEECTRFLLDNPEECPLTCLSFKKDKFSEASHRDYLGALMGLGIRRELLGDIIVRSDGCDVIVMKRLAPFLSENFKKAGRAALTCEEIDLRSLREFSATGGEEIFITASSLRLDAVLAAVFNLSRSKAALAVTQGSVFVNDKLAQKPDMPLKLHDKLVLRKKGRAFICSEQGLSAKGKIKLTVSKYT